MREWLSVASTGIIYVTKVVNPAEVAVGGACLQFWAIFGGACGSAFSTLVYTNVGNLDISLLGDTEDPQIKEDLLRGLQASYYFWAGLCFFGESLSDRHTKDYFYSFTVALATLLTFALLRDSEFPAVTTPIEREASPVLGMSEADEKRKDAQSDNTVFTKVEEGAVSVGPSSKP